jgi:hypothetical protein
MKIVAKYLSYVGNSFEISEYQPKTQISFSLFKKISIEVDRFLQKFLDIEVLELTGVFG